MREIFIKTLTGKIITLQVEPSDTIYDIKEKIQEKEGIPPHQLFLISKGKRLINSRRIDEYNIKEKDMLHIVGCLRLLEEEQSN
jgi:ubiquitin C